MANPAPDAAERLHGALGVPAEGLLVRALDEGDDGLLLDGVPDAVLQLAHASPLVVIRSSWIVPSPSGSASAS